MIVSALFPLFLFFHSYFNFLTSRHFFVIFYTTRDIFDNIILKLKTIHLKIIIPHCCHMQGTFPKSWLLCHNIQLLKLANIVYQPFGPSRRIFCLSILDLINSVYVIDLFLMILTYFILAVINTLIREKRGGVTGSIGKILMIIFPDRCRLFDR